MSRSYDERTHAAARNHLLHTSASNMTNLMQGDQSSSQAAANMMLSANGNNQGAQNQGNNQGNNGFFGGGFPGGVGLPLFGLGYDSFNSGSLFSPFTNNNFNNDSVTRARINRRATQTANSRSVVPF